MPIPGSHPGKQASYAAPGASILHRSLIFRAHWIIVPDHQPTVVQNGRKR